MQIEAIEAFDLEGWLLDHGAEGRGREWVLVCPVCGKNNLAVNVQRRLWHCWTCEQYVIDVEGRRRAVHGAGGLVKLVQLLDRLDRAQAVAKIASGGIFSYRDVARLPDNKLHDRYVQAIKPAEPVRSWAICGSAYFSGLGGSAVALFPGSGHVGAVARSTISKKLESAIG